MLLRFTTYSLLARLLFGGWISYAQLPAISFDHLTELDGLPSRVVNAVAEDRHGFIWFGTRKSLVRYDGYTVKPVLDRLVHSIATGKSGTLYCSTDMEQLAKINPDNQSVRFLAHITEGGGYNTFVDSFGDVWYSNRTHVNRYTPATGKTRHYPMRKTTTVFNKGSFVEDSHRNVWVLGMEVGLFVFDRQADKLIAKAGLDGSRPNALADIVLRDGFVDSNDVIWAAAEGAGLVCYDTRTGQLKTYQHPGSVAYTAYPGTDETGRPIIWVGTYNGLGVFRPDTKQYYFFDALIPRQYIVFSILRSQHTGITWFGTSEGVLKYDPHNQFIKTNTLPGNNPAVNAILTDATDKTGQTTWLAVSGQGLYRHNRITNQTTLYPTPVYPDFYVPAWLIQAPDGLIWMGGSQYKTAVSGKNGPADNQFEGIFRFDPRAGRYLPTPFSVHHTFFTGPYYNHALLDRKGRFWLSDEYRQLRVLDPKTNTELRLWSDQVGDDLVAGGNWILALFEDRRGRVWVSTNRGIFWFDERTRTFKKAAIPYGYLLDLAEAPDGTLWAVGWHVLIHLTADGKEIRRWSEKDGLYDLECRQVLVDTQNRVWVGTFDGLHLLDQQKNTFQRFTVTDGLLTNNTMNSLQQTPDHKLLVGNAGGWNTVDMTARQQPRPALVGLAGVRVNNREKFADWRTEVVLEPDETAISFDFSALNYRKSTDNSYTYFLEGFDKDTVNAGHSHQAFYTNLNPGSYVFHARLPGPGSGRDLRVAFRIKPVFYVTWWFRTLVILGLAGLLGLIYRNRLNYQTIKARLALEEATTRQKEAQHSEAVAAYQLRLSETEMAALRAQMNPHFIFNCLNSIQFFTAQNDSERASEYLSKFSRLIRLVLENSKSERVSLQNELETLRLYLDMEAMRFQQKVRYEIQVSDEIDTESLQIPPLLLQPFVENAIWHGLMHKEEGGTVTVSVQQPQPNRLRIEVTDNGIGRAKAAEYKSKSATKNKSFGMKMTADRIELINQLYQTQTEVRVDDLIDERGQPAGTRVVVEIPIPAQLHTP